MISTVQGEGMKLSLGNTYFCSLRPYFHDFFLSEGVPSILYNLHIKPKINLDIRSELRSYDLKRKLQALLMQPVMKRHLNGALLSEL